MIVYVYIYDNLYCFVMLNKILTSAFKILTTLLSFFFPFVSYFPLFPSFLFPFQVHRFAPIAAPFVISALMDSLSFTHVACTFAGLYVLAAISTLFLPIETRGRAIVETASNVNGEMNKENESDGILLLAPCRTVYDHQKKTKENEGRKENDVL